MKNTKLLTTAFAAIAAMGFASASFAADAAKPAASATPVAAKPANGDATGGHGKKSFISSYDTDLNASVPRAEFDAVRKKDYTRANLDGKGNLSESDYVGEYTQRLDKDLAAMRERQLKQAHVRFGVLDTDKNGAISQAEYDASGERIFKKLDTNGDGVIDEKDTAEAY